MTANVAKSLGGLAFLVFLSLGLVPLVQWFVFDHANGPIGVLFGHPTEPWVWIWPAAVCLVSFACMWIFGDLAEKQS